MTRSDHIEGGWFLLSTQLLDSSIFRGPPDILRLWLLLLGSAHRDSKPFELWNGQEVQRGELITSLSYLAKGLERAGNPQFREPIKVIPSSKTVSRWLDVMEKKGMILCSRTRNEGTRIKIVNFEYYQSFDSYKIQRESTETASRKIIQAHSQAHEPEQMHLSNNKNENDSCEHTSAQPSARECQTSDKRVRINDDDTNNTKEKRGHFALLSTDEKEKKTRILDPSWDATNGVLVVSVDKEESIRAEWAKSGVDWDAERLEFEEYHRRKKTKIKSAALRLARWKKNAKHFLPADPLAPRILNTFYDEWPNFHNGISKKRNGSDVKHANELVKWIRERNWAEDDDRIHEVCHDAIREFLANPREQGHPFAFFVRNADFYISKVVTA